jgi:hypothetical protein
MFSYRKKNKKISYKIIKCKVIKNNETIFIIANKITSSIAIFTNLYKIVFQSKNITYFIIIAINTIFD